MKSLKSLLVVLVFAALSTFTFAGNVEVPTTETEADALFVPEVVAEEERLPSPTAAEVQVPEVEIPTIVEAPEELTEEMKRFRTQAKIVVEEQNLLFKPQFEQIELNKNAIAALGQRVEVVEKQLAEALEIKKMLGDVQGSIAGLNTSVPKMVRDTLEGKANEQLAKSGLSLESANPAVAAKPATTVENGTVKLITTAELSKIPGIGSVVWRDSNGYRNVYFQSGKLFDSNSRKEIDRNTVGLLVVKKGNFVAKYTGTYHSVNEPSSYQSPVNYPMPVSPNYGNSYVQASPVSYQVGGGCTNCR